jgi:hypothetical protein
LRDDDDVMKRPRSHSMDLLSKSLSSSRRHITARLAKFNRVGELFPPGMPNRRSLTYEISVKCTSCEGKNKRKDHVILTRCEHVICDTCLRRAETKKCPKCQKSFSERDVERKMNLSKYRLKKWRDRRREVQKIYNRIAPKREQFRKLKEYKQALKDYNQYLEERESLIHDLAYGSKDEIARAKMTIEEYKKKNQKSIDYNAAQLDEEKKKHKNQIAEQEKLEEEKRKKRLQDAIELRNAKKEKRKEERNMLTSSSDKTKSKTKGKIRKKDDTTTTKERKPTAIGYKAINNLPLPQQLIRQTKNDLSRRERDRAARRAAGWSRSHFIAKFHGEIRAGLNNLNKRNR